MQALASIFKKLGFVLVNLWLVFHLVAIATSPAPMPPASPLLVDAANVALPYNKALFLDHGYHYFAPDPGSSTLISYRIERPGDVPIKGRFPDTAIFPRLKYHRYFMLAENVWVFPEDTQDEFFEAYARHFSNKHDADTISLTVLSHNPSSIPRIRAGGKLSDPETFDAEPLADYDFRQGQIVSALKPIMPPLGPPTELQPELVEAMPLPLESGVGNARPHLQPGPLQPIPITAE